MPQQRKCPESGAIIFDLTEEEKNAHQTAKEVTELKERVKLLEALMADKEGEK